MDNQEKLVSIAEYAKKHDVSVQAVYKRLRGKKASQELLGHIYEQGGSKYLDVFAVNYLETAGGRGNSIVVSSYNEEIEAAKKQIDQLKDQLIELQGRAAHQQDKIIALIEQLGEAQQKAMAGEHSVLQLEVTNKQLEAQQTQNEALAAQLELLQQELQQSQDDLKAEKTRKLSISERLFGHKKKE